MALVRRYVWAVLVGWAVFGAGVGLAGEPSAEDRQQAALHRSQGDAMMRAKDYAGAEKEYLKAVELTKPEVSKVRLYDVLATTAKRQNDAEKTVFYLRKAREAAAENREVWVDATSRLIGELIGRDDLKGAEEVARESLVKAEKSQGRLVFWSHLCVIGTKQKKLDELEKEAEGVFKKEQTLGGLLMLKNVYEAKGDKERLLKINEQIAGSFPQAELSRVDLAAALVEQGKIEDALPHLKTLASAPGHRRREFALVLAGYYLKQKKDEEAGKWLAIAKGPDAERYRAVVKAMLDAGRSDAAANELGEAIANADEFDVACQFRLERAELLMTLGSKEAAVKDYRILAGNALVPAGVAEKAKQALKKAQGE